MLGLHVKYVENNLMVSITPLSMLKCFIFEFHLVVVGCVLNLPTCLIGDIMISAIGKKEIYTYIMQVSSTKHNPEYKCMSSVKPKQMRQAMRKGVVGDIQ